jgi:hypothetical protein
LQYCYDACMHDARPHDSILLAFSLLALLLASSGCGSDDDLEIAGSSDAPSVSDPGSTTGPDNSGLPAIDRGLSNVDSGASTADPGSAARDPGGAQTDPGSQDASGCNCDDGDPCTEDRCVAPGVCENTPKRSPICRPSIDIIEPGRASYLSGPRDIEVRGKVTAPAAPVTETRVGELLTALDEGGNFVTDVVADHGVNILVAEATDQVGNRGHAVQSFLWAPAFSPAHLGEEAGDTREISDGIGVFLGAEVLDDGDITDMDDLATFAFRALQGLDIVSFLPNPVHGEGQGPDALWCQWTIGVTGVTYTVSWVDVEPLDGALKLVASLSDLTVAFEAEAPGACPDAKGTATSAHATMSATIAVAIAAAGDISVEVQSADVHLSDPTFDVTEGFAAFFDWMINWFSGDIASTIEEAAKDALKNRVAPALKQAFNSLGHYERAFEIPPVLGASNPISVSVSVRPSLLDIKPDGVRAALQVRLSAVGDRDPTLVPGSPLRSGCGSAPEPALSLPTESPMAVALHDDVVNQALFAFWWARGTTMDLDAEQIAVILPDAPVEGLDVSIDLALPPVVSSCTPGGATWLQIGDARVLVHFEVNGQPASVDAWVSASVEVDLEASAAPDATVSFTFGVVRLVSSGFQVLSTSGPLEGAEALVEAILQEVVTGLIADPLSGGVFHSFPVPHLDLGGYIPGFPTGTIVSFDPDAVSRKDGYVMLTGRAVP